MGFLCGFLFIQWFWTSAIYLHGLCMRLCVLQNWLFLEESSVKGLGLHKPVFVWKLYRLYNRRLGNSAPSACHCITKLKEKKAAYILQAKAE